MGKRKITIKPIKNDAVRKATYEKRKVGVIKKAMELSILCQCNVSVTLFTPEGEVVVYSSEPYENIMQKFQNYEGNYTLLTNDHAQALDPAKSQSRSLGHKLKKSATSSAMMTSIDRSSISSNASSWSNYSNPLAALVAAQTQLEQHQIQQQQQQQLAYLSSLPPMNIPPPLPLPQEIATINHKRSRSQFESEQDDNEEVDNLIFTPANKKRRFNDELAIPTEVTDADTFYQMANFRAAQFLNQY